MAPNSRDLIPVDYNVFLKFSIKLSYDIEWKDVIFLCLFVLQGSAENYLGEVGK